jgi:hypothetical protein
MVREPLVALAVGGVQLRDREREAAGFPPTSLSASRRE